MPKDGLKEFKHIYYYYMPPHAKDSRVELLTKREYHLRRIEEWQLEGILLSKTPIAKLDKTYKLVEESEVISRYETRFISTTVRK